MPLKRPVISITDDQNLGLDGPGCPRSHVEICPRAGPLRSPAENPWTSLDHGLCDVGGEAQPNGPGGGRWFVEVHGGRPFEGHQHIYSIIVRRPPLVNARRHSKACFGTFFCEKIVSPDEVEGDCSARDLGLLRACGGGPCARFHHVGKRIGARLGQLGSLWFLRLSIAASVLFRHV